MSGSLRLREIIDGQRVSRFHIGIVAMCFATVVIDGFDTQAIGYVAPGLVAHLGVDHGAFGPVFGAGLAGVLVGSLLLGIIADRCGRKATLLAGLALFGVGTLATTFADSLRGLELLRFVTGIGLGGAMPNALALMSDYTPKKSRTLLAAIMLCGFPVGAALGGLLAAALIADLGWPAVFYFGGLVPLAMLPVLAAFLPESPAFLLLRPSGQQRMRRLLARIDPGTTVPAGSSFSFVDETAKRFPVGALFAGGRAVFTTVLWCAFGMNLMVMYFLSSWMPTVISVAGLTVTQAVVATSLFQVGGIVGALCLGALVDRLGPVILVATYACAPILLILLGIASVSPLWLMMLLAMVGFCVVGGQTGTNAFTGGAYPSSIRATGAGWALGIGRLGSIAGSMIGGILVGWHWPISTLFLTLAAPSALATIALWCAVRTRPSVAAGRLDDLQVSGQAVRHDYAPVE